MNLLVPAALAFAVIIPIILLLYFMRPKRQERVIGSTLLWQQALQDLQASRPWQRLSITPLLLLQLLAAMIIVLILTRPALFSNSPISGNTIIILQASASMQATDVAPSRFEAAKSTIADFIDQLGSDDRLSLITMARTPQVLIAESSDKIQLNSALQHAQVTNQDADLEQTLSLALSLAEEHGQVQVLIIGDGHVMQANQILTLPFPVRYLSIGTNTANAAILALAGRTLQNTRIAFAQVANYSRQTQTLPVELYADGHLFGVQSITLTAGTNGSVQWGPLPPTARFLHARLVTQDAFKLDDEAWSMVGGSIQGKVLLVTQGNIFLEKALVLQPNVSLYETAPAQYSATQPFDLTIFDGFVPRTLPAGNLFFINPPAGSYPFGISGQAIGVNHIAISKDDNNLLENVNIDSIHTLYQSHKLTPALWAQTVITTPMTPLLIAGENDNRRIATLGFDLHDTDLPLQPAFPILIRNLTNWLLPPPVPGDGQVIVGQPVTLQTWPGASQVTITSPDQHTTVVGPPFPPVPFAGTNQPGIYQVTQQVHGQALNGAFTVNLFNATQSELAPAKALPVANSSNFTTAGMGLSHQLREIWPWIAALLLLVLCAEWWLFSSSYRVQKGPVAQQDRQTQHKATARRDILASPPPQNTLVARLQYQLQEQYRLIKKRSRRLARKHLPHTAKQTGSKTQITKGDKHANL